MQNTSYDIIRRFVVIIMAAVFAVSCSSYKDISITSCDLKTISPNGLKAVDMLLSVGVHNPTVAFTLSDIIGELHDEDRVYASFSGGPVSVEKKSDDVHDLPCSVALGDNLSLFNALNVLKTRDISTMKINVSAVVRLKNGLHKTLRYEDMSVKEILDNAGLSDKLKL